MTDNTYRTKPRDDGGRPKFRRCLRCKTKFTSQHAGIRLCDSCRLDIRKGATELDVEMPETKSARMSLL